jgi:predicted HAD superfamily phosphohydrolase YqeG
VSTRYQQFADTADLPMLVAGLGVRTIVIDVEPLVAIWDGTQEALDRGIVAVLDLLTAVAGVQAVCFTTNSARRPSGLPRMPRIEVTYIASARKPLNIGLYERLPTPAVVVGDQVLTDGLLARRLGYPFLHYRHPQQEPIGPRLLDGVGQLAQPLIFGH